MGVQTLSVANMTIDLNFSFLVIQIFMFITQYNAESIGLDQGAETRNSKVLPVFQVVKFPNAICAGASRNGTCYTVEECSEKGGSQSGSCASGFGVCCVFTLSCGRSSSENVTYISQSSVTTLTSPCTYTICPCSSNICRIRFDFTNFVIANAVAGTTSAGAVPAAGTLIGPAVGDCTDDSFSIGGGLSGGTPVICGDNTGYHMIVDADPSGEACHEANFVIGGTTVTSRSWDIRVTQYACGDYDSSGWPGCLQYHTGSSGQFASFGFPPTATAVTSGVTHLQNQLYDICIRRESGFCYICYNPSIISAAAIAEATQISYGVGLSVDDGTAESQIGSMCSTDWLDIPLGNTLADAAIDTPTLAQLLAAAAAPLPAGQTTNVSRFCGRVLALGQPLAPGIAISSTICTRALPFRVGVNFNNNEADTGTDAATTGELNEAPGGIVGFKLNYWQGTC